MVQAAHRTRPRSEDLLKCKIATANRNQHDTIGHVNLLTEEGYNLLKLAVKAGAIQ